MGRRSRKLIAISGAAVLLWWWFSVPATLFDVPHSTVLESREGQLLGARIAADGQWRFPRVDSVPTKFRQAILAFEDERFAWHPGVDPVALARAVYLNVTRGEVVSGASTLTMQVVRLSRNHPPRTYVEKLTEMFRAVRLEVRHSKEEILALYAAHAPFGGNVVGLEAASWRYFGRGSWDLSWAESAALAVLPNAPSTILPGRSDAAFLAKRNRLLDKLLGRGVLDSTEWHLARLEPLPREPLALPQRAPHALDRLVAERPGERVQSTLAAVWQRDVQHIVDQHVRASTGNEVHNAAAMVVDLQSGEVPVYVGNTSMPGVPGGAIDMLRVPRSTGSILKPFLFASAFEEGRLGPKSLVPDVPTRIGNYTPRNFDRTHRGAVTVEAALRSSLNIPAVHVLREVGLKRFHHQLRSLGFTDLREDADHYGLALILGGGEVRPLQVARTYANWLKPLCPELPGLRTIFGEPIRASEGAMEGEAVFEALEVMTTLVRPRAWEHWRPWRRVAWKTGTSFGHRDAWAVGTDGRWLVVVWTGNADNEGRPGLIGVESSAPLFFEVMDALPDGAFFERQTAAAQAEVCAQSGFKAGPHCTRSEVQLTPPNGLRSCALCQPIWLNDRGERVLKSCAPDARDTTWLILPASQQWYYRQQGGPLPSPPAWNPSCRSAHQEAAMEWLYPQWGEVIQRTRDWDGRLGGVVLEVGHREVESTVFWYEDDRFLGQTSPPHQLEVPLAPGPHRLHALDGQGNRIEVEITVSPPAAHGE